MKLLIEILGWIASVLIVGAYYFNIKGKISSSSKTYVLANLFGGIFFVINTFYHHAYPSMAVNVIWVLIAITAIFKKEK